jgi:nickel transport protein
MRDPWCIRLVIGLLVCVAVPLLVSPEPARAHKMYIFARFQAETIRGNVYFRGNTPAGGVTVEAFDPAGQKVGQTQTDEQGEFTLPIRPNGELRLIATTADGHAAEPFTLAVGEGAEEFPLVVPGPGEPQPGPSGSETPQSPQHRPAATPERKALEATIEAAVSRQVSPLRKQIAQFKREMQDQITFRDYVGGIGYILGLTGLAFYFLGVRRRGLRVTGPDAESEKVPSPRRAKARSPEKPDG